MYLLETVRINERYDRMGKSAPQGNCSIKKKPSEIGGFFYYRFLFNNSLQNPFNKVLF